MKHPLTSKERRGLAAVAAAALLCIAGGIGVRNCGRTSPQEIRVEHSEVSDSINKPNKANKPNRANKANKPNRKKKSGSKTAPAKDRSHLDEELD